LPDVLLIVLVGNMVTEEALPNYAISLEHTFSWVHGQVL
jgi:acyl-[acyl-carrier-protein] desaturase